MSDSPRAVYVDIRDAAELTGISIKHLNKLIKASKVTCVKAKDTLLVLWSDVQKLASQQKPFWVSLPDSALLQPAPGSDLLLHTDVADVPVEYPEPHFHNRVEVGNCLDWMRRMPAGIVQSVVTSPPYWGVRKYPGELQVKWSDGSMIALGEEPTVDGYVNHTLEVLRHLKRVLRDDGTIWWNIGDTYQTRAYLRESSTERLRAFEGDRSDTWSQYPNKRYSSGHPYLKDKDLTLVPFLVAIGAEHLGLYVRSVIIWYKDNTVPEPVDDRPTTSHEYILLLAKSRFYKYDKRRETEAAVTGEVIERVNGKDEYRMVSQRQLRTVWQFPTSSKHGNHTAAFPLELPLRCLRLSTTPGDLVFDPFAGSGTTLAAAKTLGCRYFGCDLFEDFIKEAQRRLLNPGEPLDRTTKRTSEKPASSRVKLPPPRPRPAASPQMQLIEKRANYESMPEPIPADESSLSSEPVLTP
jgi:DNA modification methylase